MYNESSLTTFHNIIITQSLMHPTIMPQDIIKLCYQAAFGIEHMLSDIDVATDYFANEFENVTSSNEPINERISDNFHRVSLSKWKAVGLPSIWLLNMFLMSSIENISNETNFKGYLSVADEAVKDGYFKFDYVEWKTFVNSYLSEGIAALHHSDYYRKSEKPSYRLVSDRLVRLIPILEKIYSLYQTQKVVVSIDGKAASGKTTLARDLAEITGASTAHTDDFFLPIELRTPQRLSEPGGNIHYERFITDLLPLIRERKTFSYRKFDCSIMNYKGMHVVQESSILIVEGSYSHHPKFGDYADITVFSDINPILQLKRIKERNGETVLSIFKDKWIPLEQLYFDTFNIRNKAFIVLE